MNRLTDSTRYWIPVALIFCLFTATTQVSALTPDEAVERTLENPEVRSKLQARKKSANADKESVKKWTNPTFSFELEHNATIVASTETFYMLEQEIPVTGKKRFQQEIAEQSRRLERQDSLAFKSDIAARTLELYYRLVQNGAKLNAYDNWMTSLEDWQDQLTSKPHTAERLDDLLAEAQYQRQRLKAERHAIWGRFAGLTGLETSETRAGVDIPRQLQTEFDLSELKTYMSALQERPDLKKLDIKTKRAQLRAQAAARQRIPEPTVLGGFKQAFAGGNMDPGFVLGISGPLAVWNQFSSEIDAADTRRSAYISTSRLKLRRLEKQLTGQFKAFRQHRKAVDSYIKSRLEDSKVALEDAKKAYSNGNIPLAQLLDTGREAFEAKLASIDARSELRQKVLSIRSLTLRHLP